MITREEAEKALAAVEALKDRALEIMEAPTIGGYCRFEEFAYLDLRHDTAALVWPDPDCDLGMGAGRKLIPTTLLFMGDAEFSAWLNEQREIAATKERARVRATQAAAAKAERATYERLKRKFEGMNHNEGPT